MTLVFNTKVQALHGVGTKTVPMCGKVRFLVLAILITKYRCWGLHNVWEWTDWCGSVIVDLRSVVSVLVVVVLSSLS